MTMESENCLSADSDLVNLYVDQVWSVGWYLQIMLWFCMWLFFCPDEQKLLV